MCITTFAAGASVAVKANLDETQIQSFRRDGFVTVRGLLAPPMVHAIENDALRAAIRYYASGPPHAELAQPLQETLQVRNTWQLSDPIRQIVCSLALAEVAARLLNVTGLQLYADLVVVKEPSAPAATWHIDAGHAVVDGDRLLIAYIPLNASGPGAAGLSFCRGSHRQPFARRFKPTSITNTRRVWRLLAESGCQETLDKYDPGDVAFYSGMTFHRLTENHTHQARASLWVLYLPEGETMKRPQNAFQTAERARHFNDVHVGRPITTALNPLLWRAQLSVGHAGDR